VKRSLIALSMFLLFLSIATFAKFQSENIALATRNLSHNPPSAQNPLPDLTINAQPSGSYSPNQTVQVPVTVFRSGGNLTRGTYVLGRLFWSTNSSLDSGDTQLWQSNGNTDFLNSILNNSGSHTVNATITIPSNATPGQTYYILAYADADLYHQESNENNNIAAYQATIPGNPFLSSATPLSTPVPGQQFFARLAGGNFNTSAVEVVVNGPGCSNCVVPNNVLTNKSNSQFDAPLTLGAGVFQIQARNGSSGALSNVQSLTINSPNPTLSSVTPLSTPVPGQQFFARLVGSNFNTSTVEVVVNGPGCSNCVVPNNVLTNKSATQFDAPLTLGAGAYQVQARNGGGGQLSTAQSLTINAPVPTLSSVTPLSTPTPGQQFFARLVGANFDTSTVEVVVNGPGCSNCVVPNNVLTNKSATQFDAPLTLGVGAYQVQARNSSGGALSNSQSLTVQSPTPNLSGVTPLSTPIEGQQFFARLVGSNFNTSTVEVVVNGPGCSNCVVPNNVLTNKSATQFDAPLTLGAGVFQIQVRNGGGGALSNAQPLTINSPNPTLSSVTPLSTPVPGQQFFARLVGSNFNTSTVEVVVNGPGCSNCVVPNNALTNKSNSQFDAPLTLGAGAFQIQVRNGGGGTLSNSQSLTINPPPSQAPTLSRIAPQTTPTSGARFFARLDGGSFDPNTVEVVVVGVGCPNVGACVVPNSAFKSGGVSATTIHSAPFTLAAGTFDIYVRNGGGGALSGSVKLTVNPSMPAPSISAIRFSTTPLAGQPFTAILEGSGFDPSVIQALVTGPNCSPCLRENISLGNKSYSKVEVPLTLNNVGTFQIALRNGGNGAQSNSKTINVAQQPPATFALSGTVGIWDEQAKRLWPLNGKNVKVRLKLQSGGQKIDEQEIQTGRYSFSNLTPKIYDLRVTVEYKEEGKGVVKPTLTKWAHTLKKGIALNQSAELDIHFPPVVVLVHGIWSSYEKWYHRTFDESQDIADVGRYWDQYLRRIGSGSAAEPEGFITITPDYRTDFAPIGTDTDIPLMGGWEAAVTRVGLQIYSTLQNLTTGVNDQAWPPFYYIGHSQGGLIGRVLLSGRNRNFAISRAVRYMYQLGTPNSGGAVYGLSANHTPSQVPYEYLGYDQMMRDFNRQYQDFGSLSASKIKVFAGNCPKDECRGTDTGGTDKYVPVWSVHQINLKKCEISINPINFPFNLCSTRVLHAFSAANSYVFPYNHNQLGSGESLESILKGVVIPHMAGLSGATNALVANATANEQAPESALEIKTGVTQQQVSETMTFPRRVYSAYISVAANQTQTLNFNVSATDLLIVNAFASAGTGRCSLVSPTGQIINLSSVGQTVYRDESGEWFVLNNPTPGQWAARFQADATPAQVSVAVQERSPIGFEGYVRDDGVLLNQRARLQAKWVGDSSAITSPSIIARVSDGNGNLIETITLFDDGAHDDGAAGDGVFGAQTGGLSIAGRYIVAFRAQGIYQGRLFTREAADRLDVLSVNHLFTGQFADTTLDSNDDGKADMIQITAPVNILSAGKYLVTADLYDAQGYFIDRATTFLEADSPGLHSPKLDFDVSQTNCDQFSRAFSPRNITLTDAASFRIWDQWTAQVNTRVFDGQAFGCVTVPTGLQITAIQPSSIVKGDAALARISGRSFAAGARLSLGSGVTISSLTMVNDDLIIAQINADAGASAGLRDVAVTNADGRSVTFPGGFAVTDDQAPSVTITSLSEQQVIRGQVIVSASAIDDRGIQRVEFFPDSGLALTDTSFPYQFEWDTRGKTNGQHTLTVKAYDSANQSGSAQLNVVISNSIAPVSAASYIGTALASESIAAIFGSGMATGTQMASSLPLPTTLAGSSVKVKDSAGTERLASLFFVSPAQINCLTPPGTADGVATLTVTTGDGLTLSGAVDIQKVAPGLFSANANGQDVAAAVVLRVKSNGAQTFEAISRFDTAQNRFVSLPIDLGPGTDQVFLVMFGTGWRFRSSLSAVAAQIGGVNAEARYAGPQGSLVGLDQLNLFIPHSLAGRGEVDVTLTVDGKVANAVRVNIR